VRVLELASLQRADARVTKDYSGIERVLEIRGARATEP
jgi:hypothetical protein